MKIRPLRKACAQLFVTLLLALLWVSFKPDKAYAFFCGGTCTCVSCVTYNLCCSNLSPRTPADIINDRFDQLREDYILDQFYFNTVDVAYRNITMEWAGILLMQGRMIGGFYDAQNHSKAQLELQKLAAQALTDYMPSEPLCQFGTLVKALPASDLSSKTNQIALSEIALSRHLGVLGNVASAGRGQDMANRMNNFINAFCDTTESNDALGTFCSAPPPNSARFNLDINYARTLAVPETLNVNFTNNAVTTQENDLISLANNLYGHPQIIQRMDDEILDTMPGQTVLPLLRSIDAKRSVAQNSFNAIAGMKAAGTGSSRTYVRQVLGNLGMSAGDTDRFMASAGATPGPAVTENPSYYAQMDILTKRIYQNPAFLVNLMDKPANVLRQSASMEGLELMQNRDIFSSMSRSEMLLAVLVEMEAIKLQNNVQNNMTTK